ncbi:MAG: hypothetical protein JSV49_11795 [Thermoplasmata archaeon]|nr:MAG: hypothetical protein JSV49_11795 [Thermoplasmata archaeon]
MTNYDDIKEYNGKVYTGMRVGGSHSWFYPEGRWNETKVAPDKWEFSFESLKRRNFASGNNTGAKKGTTFHWYIIADQKATKLDNDSYNTEMSGVKFKIGHKRPYWKSFSYDYDDQLSYKDKVIKVLEETLAALKSGQY